MDGLTKGDIQRAREAARLASDLEQRMERAKACHIDCSEIDERCQLAKKQLAAIIETYGPFFPVNR